MDERTRRMVAYAVEKYAKGLRPLPRTECGYMELAERIEHGELILCEYVDPAGRTERR